MFSNGAYATIWDVKGEEKYVDARISTSRKEADGKYTQDFSAIVRFVGEAKEVVRSKKARDRIKIISCGVTNKFDKEKNKLYTNYVVFNCEDASSGKKAEDADKKKDIENSQEDIDMNGELPF